MRKEETMKRTIIASAVGFSLMFSIATIAFASGNPSGTGQPNADCANESSMPTGFGTSGFAHAEAVYAGSFNTPSANNSQSGNAVSQYDVACYQVSSH